MKIHYYEQEGNADKSYRGEGDASWVLCGKHISNDAVTIDEDEVCCGTCTKILDKSKAAAA